MDAVIFDMDGVISDTQRLHSEVEAELLRGWGIAIEPAVAGMTAARAAGMRCVALASDPTRPLPAHVAVRSLREAVAEPERILGLG